MLFCFYIFILHGAADVFHTEKLRYSLLNFIFSLDYWSQTVLNPIKSFPGNASERVHSQLPGNKYFRLDLLLLMCWCHMPLLGTPGTVPERRRPWCVSGREGTRHRPINDLGASYYCVLCKQKYSRNIVECYGGLTCRRVCFAEGGAVEFTFTFLINIII